ncbi:protein of unknown function (plasmid) [Cupriavidus taiwanensis]|uniref:Uncharacterized protein n=1 Tax=Cupriavidus taiwanensis TaxID=164546 RepID=A0A375IVW8_9BURK|nr:hypothetical protein CT19425_U520007 [Cupriavidus taiwanensis]SPK77562.1 protein of unknown function [Cupriavidus taiwanensis]
MAKRGGSTRWSAGRLNRALEFPLSDDEVGKCKTELTSPRAPLRAYSSMWLGAELLGSDVP